MARKKLAEIYLVPLVHDRQVIELDDHLKWKHI